MTRAYHTVLANVAAGREPGTGLRGRYGSARGLSLIVGDLYERKLVEHRRQGARPGPPLVATARGLAALNEEVVG